MTNVASGALLLLVGGYIFVMYGNVVFQSFRDQRVRDDLLNSPHLIRPTPLHKIVFAALAALLLAFAGWLIVKGLSDLLT